MRISDWSSDVCSSDLATTRLHLQWSFPIMFTRVSRGGTGLQTGLSAWILAIVRALEEADVDPAPLMQGIGMDASRIGDLNYRYSQEQVTSLWIAAVGETGDPHFGLKVARNIRPWTFHVVGYAMSCSATLRRARSEEHTSELQSLMRTSY